MHKLQPENQEGDGSKAKKAGEVTILYLIPDTPLVIHTHVLVVDDLELLELPQENSQLGFAHVYAHLVKAMST